MKKYILFSSLTTFFFPLIMFFPLFFLSLFIHNPLLLLTNITGTDSTGFILAGFIWIIIGGLIGYLIFTFRNITYTKKGIPVPSFGFSAIILTILIQLVITYIVLYLI
jgi:hypothetical protein